MLSREQIEAAVLESQPSMLAAVGVFGKYKGKYLAVDNNPALLEGAWNYSRLVLIEFPSHEDLAAWNNSADYQTILKYILAAADCATIVAEGRMKTLPG